jgi:hypothetical protein
LDRKKLLNKKHLRFQPAVRVVLIPSRTEYTAADLNIELWWDDSDYSAFKASAVLELKALMRSRNLCNSKEAIRILYQPAEEGEIDQLDQPTTTLDTDGATSSRCNSPAPTIDDENNCGTCAICPDEELELNKLLLLTARTDLDLTDPHNFDKIHAKGEAHTTTIGFKKIHPLAYMCE